MSTLRSNLLFRSALESQTFFVVSERSTTGGACQGGGVIRPSSQSPSTDFYRFASAGTEEGKSLLPSALRCVAVEPE